MFVRVFRAASVYSYWKFCFCYCDSLLLLLSFLFVNYISCICEFSLPLKFKFFTSRLFYRIYSEKVISNTYARYWYALVNNSVLYLSLYTVCFLILYENLPGKILCFFRVFCYFLGKTEIVLYAIDFMCVLALQGWWLKVVVIGTEYFVCSAIRLCVNGRKRKVIHQFRTVKS